MYRLFYKEYDKEEWQCLGEYTDIEVALNEMDKLSSGVLGKRGAFELRREGYMEG